MRAQSVSFPCSPTTARDGEVIQRQHFFVITKAQFAIQNKVMKQPNCTERLHVDATIMRSFFRQSIFHVSYRGRMPDTSNWPMQRLGNECQSSEMAALLNSLSFAFTNSFLPKYRVKYYDYNY